MSILQSLLRFYFLNLALNTAWEKVIWNLKVAPRLMANYPVTQESLFQSIESGDFFQRFGLHLDREAIEWDIDTFGFESTLDLLQVVVAQKGHTFETREEFD